MTCKRFLSAVVILTALALPLAAASAAPLHVVVPFANDSGEESLYWMAEGLAIGITDHLLATGARVVEAERRREAMLEMGLEGHEPLTSASAILLARRLGAQHVVTGSYRLLEGHRLALHSEVLSSGDPAPARQETVQGDMGDFHHLQRDMASRILAGQRGRTDGSGNRHMRQLNKVPLSSFELYAQAMVSSEPERRRTLLSRALEADPHYAAALLQRARLEIEEGRPQSAFVWLDRVQLEEMAFPERYWQVRGDASAAAGDRGSAVDHYHRALKARPLATTHFRLAAVLARQGKLPDARREVETGLGLDPLDPEGLELKAALAHDHDTRPAR